MKHAGENSLLNQVKQQPSKRKTKEKRNHGAYQPKNKQTEKTSKQKTEKNEINKTKNNKQTPIMWIKYR